MNMQPYKIGSAGDKDVSDDRHANAHYKLLARDNLFAPSNGPIVQSNLIYNMTCRRSDTNALGDSASNHNGFAGAGAKS